jgi:hypothetical protein
MHKVMVELARDILAGRVDRIDGIWRLGREINNYSDYDAERMVVLLAASDALEEVPHIEQRDLWNRAAYERQRARGEAILARYGDAIDEALTFVAAQPT